MSFLFQNALKNVWFTRVQFHEKSTECYEVIEKNLFKERAERKDNNPSALFPFRLFEEVNKHFLDSFTYDVLPRQNNRNSCKYSLSSLTDSNANNRSWSSDYCLVFFSVKVMSFKDIFSLNIFLPTYFIKKLKGNTHSFNPSILHLAGETIFYSFHLGPISLLPPCYFEKTGTKVPIETSDDDCATESNNRANDINNVTSAGSNTHNKAGYYEMMKEPRGACIIINNTFEKYDGQSYVNASHGEILLERTGTNYDKDRLKNLFEWLHFQVFVKSDLTAEEMRNVFRQVATGSNVTADSEEDCQFQRVLSDSDCFVFFILSHGFNGGVYGNDGECLGSSEIREYLAGNRCKRLRKKPKLGFIQACRGDKDIAFVQRDSPSMVVPKSPVQDTKPGDSFQNQATKTESVTPSSALTDILIYDGTARGETAFCI